MLYFDGESDLCPDLHLIRASILHLITAVSYEVQQGWSKEMQVLLFIYWLAHAASYKVVTSAFDIPWSIVQRLVHKVSKAVLGLFKKVVRIPQSEELEVLGAGLDLPDWQALLFSVWQTVTVAIIV